MAYNLTASGTVSHVTGKFGNALDSTNGYYYTNTSYGAATAAGTIEAWVKTTATGQILAIGNTTTSIGLGQNASNQPVFFYANSVAVNGTTAINDGAWHHLAGVYTGSSVSLYVDGTRVATTSSNATFNFSSGSTGVGASGDGTNRWTGQVDEARFSSTARYTAASFTVATAAFASDANTIALYHLESSGVDSAVGAADAVNGTSGLSARYRADSITGVASGGSVASWPDTSGNGYTATQGTAAYQPTYVTNVTNNRASVRWPASGTTFMTSSAPSGSATQTIFMVVGATSGSISSNSTIRGSDIAGGLQTRLSSSYPNNLAENQTNLGSSSTALTAGAPTIIIATFNSSSGSTWRINGTTAGGSSTTATLASGALTWIGGNGANTGEYWQGDIFEIATWNRVLSQSEAAAIDSYAQDRYAIAVSDYVATATSSSTSRFVRNIDLTSLVLANSGFQIANTQTANYTLVRSDVGKAIEMNVASANTVTIPTNANVAFPVGSLINLYQVNTGATTITAASGVTLRAPLGATLKSQYAVAQLRQRTVDEWVLSGNLTP